MKIKPPKRPIQFLRWFCREDYLDEIEGDLTELYEKQHETSPSKAKRVFAWTVIKYFRPEFLKLFTKSQPSNAYGMYRNYFKVAFRNLARHRHFTFVNVAGLTLGTACALFIYLIVSYELSYDRYHAKADCVYRVNWGSPDESDTGTPHGLAGVLRTDFPEMEDVGIILKLNPEQSNIEINKELFREQNTFLVQPSIFAILDFEWLQGSPESLEKPRQAVVAKSIADKYFHGDAVGKVLKLNNGSDFTITGIIADAPLNTDFPIKIAISYATLEKMNVLNDALDGGTNSYSHTYFTLREDADPLSIDPKLQKMIERHLPKERQKNAAFSIQPLSDIHFNVGNFNQRTIARETIHTLQVIGLFVLVIACINFVNLASAQAVKRAKEVGVRKTLGGTRHSLVLQFLCETFLVTLFSLVIAFGLTSQFVSFSQLLFSIPLSIDALLRMDTVLFMLGTLVGVTLLSGFYPAFILSGFLPAHALKGTGAASGLKGLFVRKGLITFQFLISQVLIVCTLIAIRQTDHFRSAPLGFNKDAVITFDLPDSKAATLSSLKNNLLTHGEISDVSFSLNTPSATINKWWTDLKHASFQGENRITELKFIDSTYLRLFEIQRVAGTMVIPDETGKSVIVNESLVRELGIKDPENAIGEKITYESTDATIIGVVQDFQTVSLHQGFHSVVITNTGYFAKGSVKIEMSRASEAIASIEKHWKEAFPGNYFTYAFLDDQLATFYKEERKVSRLLVTFAVVAISIGCIGLFGLIAFVATQRAKEVSIRKILGATVTHLATLLSSDFIKLVVLAGLIAWPIAYYAMDKWLQGFVNRIELLDNSWAFLLSLVAVALVALITISLQTVKSAMANPVDSLRSE